LEASGGEMLPVQIDPNLLSHQFRRTYKPSPDGTMDVMVDESSLSVIDIQRAPVQILDLSKEIQFGWDPSESELTIIRSIYDSRLKRRRVTDEHVFKQISITTNIAADGELAIFATREGVRALPIYQFKDSLFVAPIIAPIVMPAPPPEDDTTIAKLEFLTPESAPRPLNTDRIESGDIVATITPRIQQDNVVNHNHWISRRDVIMALRMQMLVTLAQLQVIHPELDGVQPVLKVLRENVEDLEVYLAEQQKLLGSAEQNDLVRHALRNLGLHVDLKKLARQFTQNAAGQDYFTSHSEIPRHTFSADPSMNGEWIKQYRRIIETRDSKPSIKDEEKLNWRQILIDSMVQRTDAEMKSMADKERGILSRYFSRIASAYKTYATPIRMTALSAALVGGTNYVYEGVPIAWMLSTISHISQWSTQLPVVGAITGPVVEGASYFTDRWAFSRWATGTAIVLSFYPISLLLGKVATIRNAGWSASRGFFNYGIRAYAYINYPIQKLFWNAMRQPNIYKALDAGVNPLTHPRAFNSPLASKELIRAKADTLSKVAESESVLRSRSLLVAAAIVSEGQTQKGQSIDIATLLMGGEGEQVSTFLDIAQNMPASTRWRELTLMAYQELEKIENSDLSRLDEATIAQYIVSYHEIAQRFQARYPENPGLHHRIQNSLIGLRDASCKMMSQNILPFVLFGKQGYDVFRQFRRASVDQTTAEIADSHYKLDYLASGAWYAGAAPAKFGDIPVMGDDAAQVLANQSSQVFIYGVQGAVDPLTAAPETRAANEYAPLTHELYGPQRVSHQTFWQGLGSMMTESDAGYTSNHAKYMVNVLKGLQVRMAADWITRSVGLYLKLQATGAFISLGATLFDASQLSLFFLLNKVSFQVGAIGYASVWPYIQLAMRRMKDEVALNLAALQKADYLVDAGIRLDDREMLERGVETLKELFIKGKLELPLQYRAPTDEYTKELAAALQAHSLDVNPVPTKDSASMNLALNIGIGSLISTVLFDSLSEMAYDTSVDPSTKLLKTAATFSASFVALKTAGPVIRKTKKVVAQAVKAIGETQFGQLCKLAYKALIQ